MHDGNFGSPTFCEGLALQCAPEVRLCHNTLRESGHSGNPCTHDRTHAVRQNFPSRDRLVGVGSRSCQEVTCFGLPALLR